MKRKLIGVLMSAIHNDYQQKVLSGIMSKANEYDYDIAVFSTLISSDGRVLHINGEKNIFSLPNYEKFDGIIFDLDTIRIDGVHENIVNSLKEKCKVPVVSLNNVFPEFYSVISDDKASFKKVIQHLIDEHGLRRINFLTGPKDLSQSETRLQAYIEAMENNNIPVEQERIFYGDFWREAGKIFVSNILKSSLPLPQAIVCANDIMAMTVYSALVENGIRVPEDIAVTGYDNSREAAEHFPPITSIKPPLFEMGIASIEIIHNHINNIKIKKITKCTGTPVLTNSCGCLNKIIMTNTDRNIHLEMDELREYFSESHAMVENLTSATSLKESIDEICIHSYQIKQLRDFYLCLCKDWNKFNDNPNDYLKDGYTKTMKAELVMKDFKFVDTEYEFNTNIMLPDMFEEHDEPTTYFFTPIHFKDRCFGYSVINYFNKNKISDLSYRTWSRNINNALEFIRVQGDLKWCLNEIDNMSIKDTLTGIYNRRGFDRFAYPLFNNCVENKKTLLIVSCDLDQLKGINDNYGHAEGDSAICTVANAFIDCFHTGEICSRISGDEFIVIGVGDYTSLDVKKYKSIIKNFFINYNLTSAKPYKVNASLGFYCDIPSFDMNLQECIRFADAKMYTEKNKRKKKLK